MREASKRVLGLRPFDVQLIGSMTHVVVTCIELLSVDFFKSCHQFMCSSLDQWVNILLQEPIIVFHIHNWPFESFFICEHVGGMVLHKGEIAEMRTGEGKTLVAILPAYLNALAGKGVHVVTVNDYLARRDCEWVGQVPRFLGLKVGLIQRMSHSSIYLQVAFCNSQYLCLLCRNWIMKKHFLPLGGSSFPHDAT